MVNTWLAILLASSGASAFINGQTKHGKGSGIVQATMHRHHHSNTHLSERAPGADSSYVDNLRNSYYIEVGLGTPPQQVYVVMDTGSDELWVDPNCAKSYNPNFCNLTGHYDPSKSSSKTGPGQTFSITYGTGDVYGQYYMDSMTIGSVTVPDEIFGVATDSSFTVAGVMGLSWGHGYNTDYYTIVDILPIEGWTNSRLFSIELGAQLKDEAGIIFGGVDTKKYSGKLGRTPMQVPGIDDTYRYWVVLTSVGVTKPGSSTSTVLSTPDYALDLILDTGGTISQVPQDFFDAILAYFPGAAPIAGSKSYSVPCSYLNSTGTIDFGFYGGETMINVPFSEFVWAQNPPNQCVFGLAPTTGDIILGDTFLRGAYVAYDQDNQAIYMANYVNCGTNVQAVPAGKDAAQKFVGQCPPRGQVTSTSSTTTAKPTSTTTSKTTSSTSSSKTTTTSSTTKSSSTSTSTTKSTSTSTSTTKTTSTSSTSTTKTSTTTSTSTTKPTSTTSTSSTKSSTTTTKPSTFTTVTTTTTAHPTCVVDKCLSTMQVSRKTSSASSYCNSILATPMPTIAPSSVPKFLTQACGTTSLAKVMSSACGCFESNTPAVATTKAKI